MRAFLEELCSIWRVKLKLAREAKGREFQKDADECMRFYHRRHDFVFDPAYWASRAQHEVTSGVYQTDTIGWARPSLKVTVNKVAEFVQVFGPFLYYQNPVRMVTPRELLLPPPEIFVGPQPTGGPPAPLPGQPLDPLQMAHMQRLMEWQQKMGQFEMIVQQEMLKQTERAYKGKLIERVLNYTPNELNLKEESRNATDEALIKGMGLCYTQIWQPSEGNLKAPGTFYESVDNQLIDPDAELIKDAGWCALRCTEPWWKAERRYQLPYGSLKEYARNESANQQSATDVDDTATWKRQTGQSCDQITYYRIWSRMGMGGRLQGYDEDTGPILEQFDDNLFLVIAEGVPFPLNAPPDAWAAVDIEDPAETGLNALKVMLAWPIPFHRDDVTPWPFADLSFHWRPRSVWPIAHLTFGMGYQIFLDWAFSFMASRMTRACRDGLMYDKAYGDDILQEIKSGKDLWLLGVDKKDAQFEEVVSWIKSPEMNKDWWSVLSAIEEAFERITGMTPLMSGASPHAFRSAEEANLKGDFAKVRPDDMANKVGHWQTMICRKEGLAAQWEIDATNVAPIIGDLNAVLWEKLIHSTDMSLVSRELDFRIEAGSAKRPNVEAQLANSQEAAQFVMPLAMQVFQGTGDPKLLNALLKYWGEPRKIDPSVLQVDPLPPPMPPPESEPKGEPKAEPKAQE